MFGPYAAASTTVALGGDSGVTTRMRNGARLAPAIRHPVPPSPDVVYSPTAGPVEQKLLKQPVPANRV